MGWNLGTFIARTARQIAMDLFPPRQTFSSELAKYREQARREGRYIELDREWEAMLDDGKRFGGEGGSA